MSSQFGLMAGGSAVYAELVVTFPLLIGAEKTKKKKNSHMGERFVLPKDQGMAKLQNLDHGDQNDISARSIRTSGFASRNLSSEVSIEQEVGRLIYSF